MRSITRALVVMGLVAGIVAAAGTTATARTTSGAPSSMEPRTITAVGTGVVKGTPDVLELSLGVSTRERSAAEALSKNSELANKVVALLRVAGVEEKDVQTSGLSISPVFDDNDEHLVAYAVVNTVNAEVHKIGDAGKIIDAATKVAGDSIVVNSLYFSFDDNSGLVSAARQNAVKRAKVQAAQLAQAAGVELGDLMTIGETGTPYGPPLPFTGESDSSAKSATPISPGTETTTVDVTLVYAIR